MRRITDGANRSLLARLPKSPRIIVRDIRQQFLNSRGETIKSLMPDHLHLSRTGYEIWANDLHESLTEPQAR
jgi:lysophospholipase L1-like esterase